MEVIELITEAGPLVLSALATIVAFVKGKRKPMKSVEEIKAKADKKYYAYVEKQFKKNKIENVSLETAKESYGEEKKSNEE